MARWTQTARLSNPASTIQPGDVKLTILVDGKEVSGREIRLEYQLKDGKQVEPTFQVSMTNNSQRTLYCGLLDLTQRFRVYAGLLKAGCVKLEPGETAWGNLGKPIPATVPDEIWEQGVIEYKDMLKLIVCTEEFDARLLEQPALDMPRPSRGRHPRHRPQRHAQPPDAEGPDARPGRRASRRPSTTGRRRRSRSRRSGRWRRRPSPPPARPATLAGGVKLEGHPALKAKARLATAPLSTRDLGNVTLPRLLYDDPSVSQPLTFTASRGNDPGLSVLELTDVNDPSVVTPEAPLRVTVPLALQANEHVLPVAFDGEFFLPLGRVESRSADATVIALDRLPPPLADAGRWAGRSRSSSRRSSARWSGSSSRTRSSAPPTCRPTGPSRPSATPPRSATAWPRPSASCCSSTASSATPRAWSRASSSPSSPTPGRSPACTTWC